LVHKENNTFGYAIIKKMANHLSSKSSRIAVEHVFSNNNNNNNNNNAIGPGMIQK
jgi:transcription elongation factor GreA-like protein